MKRKKKSRQNARRFCRSFAISAVCVFCAALFYLGICECYEAVRTTCFSDDRSAVVIGHGYLKFLDFEFGKK